MGKLTTHVLDTAGGRPGAGMTIELFSLRGAEWTQLRTVKTNADGRTDGPLLDGDGLKAGVYELRFRVGEYFNGKGFFEVVPVRFRVEDAGASYHVPLLCSPWSYTTYRGS
jgi:5-hydroxyisourate hydrolase